MPHVFNYEKSEFEQIHYNKAFRSKLLPRRTCFFFLTICIRGAAANLPAAWQRICEQMLWGLVRSCFPYLGVVGRFCEWDTHLHSTCLQTPCDGCKDPNWVQMLRRLLVACCECVLDMLCLPGDTWWRVLTAPAKGREEAPARLREHEVPACAGGDADQEGGGRWCRNPADGW